MSSKSVWIINQYAGSPYHGMEYRHYYLGKSLIQKGYKVYIISGSFSHLYSNKPSVYSNFTHDVIDGIDYWWVKIPNYRKSISISRIWNMLLFMFKLIYFPIHKLNKPDAIIVSSPSLFPIVIARNWAKQYKAKLLFEVRDIWPLTLEELGNLSSYHPLIVVMKWFERYGYKKADRVVSLLPNALEHFVSNGMKKEKFVYAPNGISLKEMDKNEMINECNLTFPKDKFIVGFAGTLNLSNSIDILIKAAEILRDKGHIHFVIVGSGDYETELKKTGRNCENITFIPAIKKAQVQSMLSYFSVLYLGVKKKQIYRFGISLNKLYDYMYAKKPIIYAISSGNMPVEEARCGISVEAENPQAVANAILKLYYLPQNERVKMGENGRNYVLEKHVYDKIAEQFISTWSS